ncbi:hypothetical protein [Bradyrhizobium sp. AUGA SZCCT0182]|uniref:hypothetical protein n=1 Tax=Bradyrhizobium sp. AUGA SZCCT0182 TaxID=2807667 RepID=UPI001BA67830|nr:hypothetical protein [Bradyrhizobium sp. AUGA SZCCT0182]MBR1232020.1 hypothetical protein [Bradyrhizobium sp. AUGA SZCCT0182]
MSNKVGLLNDAALETVTGGNTASASTPPATTVSRVKTSEKLHQAVMAVVKG